MLKNHCPLSLQPLCRALLQCGHTERIVRRSADCYSNRMAISSRFPTRRGLDNNMKNIQTWRCNAETTNPNRDTQSQRNGIRELRPSGWYSDACEAQEKGVSEAAEKEQDQGLAFSLSAPLAFSSLSLLTLSGKPVPRQSPASNLRANESKPL